MKVYYNGSSSELSLTACPAGHLPAAECPKEWFEEDGAPRSFSVHFRDGAAIVEPSLGRYLVAHKIARSTRIILPGLSL